MLQASTYVPGPRVPPPPGEVLTYGARYGVPWLNVKQTLLNVVSAFDRLSLTQTGPFATRPGMNPALQPGGRYPVGPMYPPGAGVRYPAHGRGTPAPYYGERLPGGAYAGEADPYLNNRYGAMTPNPYGPSYGRSRTPGAEWGAEYPGRRTWSYDGRPRSRGRFDEFGRPVGMGGYPNRDGYYDEMDGEYGEAGWHGHGKRYGGREGYDNYYGNEYMNRPGGSIHETTEYISGVDPGRRRYGAGEALRGRYAGSRGVDGYVEDETIYDDPHSTQWARAHGGHGHREHRSSRAYPGDHRDRARSLSVDPRLQPAGYIDAPPADFPDDIVPIGSRPGSEYSSHSRPASRSGYVSSGATRAGAGHVGGRFGSRGQSPFPGGQHRDREYRESGEALTDSDEDEVYSRGVRSTDLMGLSSHARYFTA